jgi:transposase
MVGSAASDRLIPPQDVRPYVKGNKHDAADAEAIGEAVTRPTMRFVPVKTIEQQSICQLHRIRQLLVKQKTMQVNALRGHLAELGIWPSWASSVARGSPRPPS